VPPAHLTKHLRFPVLGSSPQIIGAPANSVPVAPVRAESVDAGAQVEEQAGNEQQAEDPDHHQVARQRRQHLLLVHVGHLAAGEEDTSAQPAAAGVSTTRGTVVPV
jgi:hypothetical protein